MKVFRLNTYMILPDHFSGTFDEALELWLRLKNATDPVEMNANVSIRVAHEAMQLNNRYGFTTVAETGVWHLKRIPIKDSPGRGWAWVRSDKNPDFSLGSGDTWIK